MSNKKIIGLSIAGFVMGLMALSTYMMAGMDGLTGYAFGSIFASQWTWVLKGVK